MCNLRIMRLIENRCMIGPLQKVSMFTNDFMLDIGATTEVELPYITKILTYI